MAKITIAGDAAVVTSAMKLEDIKTIEKYRPKELVLKGGEDGKEPIFAVGTTNGAGNINAFGASFGDETRDDEKLACITLFLDGVTGDGIQVTMVDMGDHFRIICADIELVKQPKPMPKIPVARIMYRHKPNFQIGTAAWCYAGGAHHSVVSTALTRDDIAMFARLTGTELITIGEDTTEADLQKFFMK